MAYYELNMDGLVGPTHHYAGLSHGNLASTTHALQISNPAAAAHQGIEKMRFLHRLGIKQAVLPPQPRPNLELLHQLGFTGTAQAQIKHASRVDKTLLSACYSASSMWTANAATVSASSDTDDKRVHFTASNLISHLHRHQEADFSHQLLQQLFRDERYFHHHPVLPKTLITSDEGAANHSRLSANHGNPGVNLFVYGKYGLNRDKHPIITSQFIARQTLEASEAIARSHQLKPDKVLFARQNPLAIDQGVFHNDVIATANESVLLLHEDSYVDQPDVLAQLRDKADFPITIIEINRQQISIAEAVNTYLFNSQLLTLPGSKNMLLLAPIECEQYKPVKIIIDDIIADTHNPITDVHYINLKQSMHNGGGPACLRLRVPLTDKELSAMHQGILVDEALLNNLDTWVDKYYRPSLHVNDLADPALLLESLSALDALTTLLSLGSLYPFQR